jgi:sugar/nucleoside kinase (ribokinase family)
MNIPLSVNTLICGKLTQETIINIKQEYYINKVGGNLLYTAYGHHLWRKGAGLAAKVGENFSEEWLAEIQANQFNTGGVKRLPLHLDMRAFYVFVNEDEYRMDNPQKYFFDLGIPFPKSLLGYTLSPFQLDNRKSGSETSMRTEDIPAEFRDCQFLYMAPTDFLTHSLIPPLFRSNTASTVILNPAEGYMQPSFWYDIPAVLRGAVAVITTEKRANKLFLGRSTDIWEIAQTIASFGVDLVIITAGKNGQYLYDHGNKKKYHIPSYPVQVVDTIAANDAFGGGFLAGYALHFDPIMAVLMGNITASIKIEGSTPDFLLQAMPELAQARLEHLRGQVAEC